MFDWWDDTMQGLLVPLNGLLISVPVLTSEHMRVLGQVHSGIIPDGKDEVIEELSFMGLLEGHLLGWKN